MTRVELYKKKQCLITARERGAEVLSAIYKYEQDKKKQGIFIRLDQHISQ